MQQTFPTTLSDVTETISMQPSMMCGLLSFASKLMKRRTTPHIILRFELGSATYWRSEVADLPGAWNRRMQKMFNLKVPVMAWVACRMFTGVPGWWGYFPTPLGNLYAARVHGAGECSVCLISLRRLLRDSIPSSKPG